MVSKKNIVFSLSILVSCIPLFLTFNRGINYFDEGYILEAARRIAGGELPYRDFHFVYTPITPFFLSFFLRIGGQFVLIERLVSLLISVVGIGFLGLLTRKITKNTLLVFLVPLFYAVWGGAHLNFLWPVMVVLPLLFIYLYMLLGSRFFLAGVLMGVILLCKHNFGFAMIISFIISLLWCPYPRKRIVQMLSGFIGILGIFFMYLALTGSLIPFLADMNTYTIQAILIKKSFSVPFPTQTIGKFLLYLFPGMISLGLSVVMIIQKKRRLLFMPLTLFSFYLFGIFPTPDWPHLTPLISMVGVIFILLPGTFGVRSRHIYSLLLICLIGLGIYSLLVRNYYRWEAPIIKHTYCFSSGPMKYMCLDEKNKDIVSKTIQLVASQASAEHYIFTYYNNPIHYFLTQKDNPTRFIDFNTKVGIYEEREVIADLVHKKVNFIVTRFPPTNGLTKIISGFIEKDYSPIQTSYEFTVWKKKD